MSKCTNGCSHNAAPNARKRQSGSYLMSPLHTVFTVETQGMNKNRLTKTIKHIAFLASLPQDDFFVVENQAGTTLVTFSRSGV
jgi:hypothetical protein